METVYKTLYCSGCGANVGLQVNTKCTSGDLVTMGVVAAVKALGWKPRRGWLLCGGCAQKPDQEIS